jgi:putative MFS transporter
VAAVLSRALVPTHWLMSGWRWVMMIGAAGALLTWWFRRRLPESPRWLASRGRIAEAEAVVEALEEENLSSNSRDKRPHQERAGTASAGEKRPHEAAKKAAFGELWRAPYLGRTVMLMIFQALQTIGFYGFANWAPTFLMQQGVSLLRSLEYTMLIAAVSPAGPLLAAWTSDKLERKWTIIVLALSVAALGLGFGNSSAPGAVVGFGALLTLANYWFSAAFHAYQAELFPTRLRGTGVGFTYSWSRLSAAFTSVLVGWVLGFGVPAVFALLAAAMGLVALVVGAMGPRTNGMVLEEIAG